MGVGALAALAAQSPAAEPVPRLDFDFGVHTEQGIPDRAGSGLVLKPGMTFTIEPMVNAGKKEIRSMKDGWTVKTKDRSLSAQYEHTIVVTENGCEILTLRKDDTIPAIISHDA